MSTEEVHKLLDDTNARLAEHFEAVQIMVSWTEGGLTKASSRGIGNWYARKGLARHLEAMDLAEEQADQIARATNPPPDEGEGWKAPAEP